MRLSYLYVVWIALCYCIACTSASETTSQSVSRTDSLSTHASDLQKIAQAKALNGHWLSDSYTKNIEQSLSVYASREYHTRLFGFILSEKNLRTDSAYLDGFTEHEGGYGCPLRFETKWGIFVADATQPDRNHVADEHFRLSLKNPTTLLMHFSQSGHIDTYRKVPDADTELRRILFAGTYQDSLTGNTVVFKETGEVTGFGKQQFYAITYDFGEGIEYDAVIFVDDAAKKNASWDKGTPYHFKRTKNTLTLYKITPNWETMNHAIDSTAQVFFRH